MAHLWWVLGLVLELSYITTVVPLSVDLASFVDPILFLLACATFLAKNIGLTIPRYPPDLRTWPRGQSETRGIAMLDHRGFPMSGKLPTIVEFTLARGDFIQTSQ